MNIDPLLSYSINKFFLLFIPKVLLDNLAAPLTALLVTMIPYTPIDVMVFSLIFLIIYFTNIFGLGSQTIHYCRFNKPESRKETNVWTTLKNTYYFYFLIALMINYNTIAQYKFFNIDVRVEA